MDRQPACEELEQKVKHLENRLREYEESDKREHWMSKEFKELAERLNEGLYRYDMKARQMIFCNRALFEILAFPGATKRDITPNFIRTRIHPDDLGTVRKSARKSREKRADGEVEYRYMGPDGSYRWKYDRWRVIKDSSGEPRYLEGIVSDTTKRKLVELTLKESRARLRLLSSHLLEAQENERRRISLELHDELGQSLTVLKLQLGSIRKKLPLDQAALREDVENTQKYVDLIIENVRRLSHDLSPSILEDLGLDAALRLLIKEFVNHSNVQIFCESRPIAQLFSKESQIIIYRIFQESLTNIGKHSKASRIWITIKQEDGAVAFTIKDDGVGFDTMQPVTKSGNGRGLGLTALDERARMLGGYLRIESEKGHGTEIVCVIPTDEVRERHECMCIPNSIG